jgi:hypothetical protein
VVFEGIVADHSLWIIVPTSEDITTIIVVLVILIVPTTNPCIGIGVIVTVAVRAAPADC